MASTAAAAAALRPIVICGPSGTGKSTLLKKLFDEFPDRFGFSVSHTTRQPRAGERDGVAYHFVTRDAFMDLVRRDAFIEWAEFSGNCYGTSAAAVRAVSATGTGTEEEGRKRRCILDIDTQGVKLIKKNHASLDAWFVFIAPPSIASLRERLGGRGTETDESIQKRLAAAVGELEYAKEEGAFDRIVVNDDVERAYGQLKKAIDGHEADSLPSYS